MPQMIFVNLPVADLSKSTAFYERIGGRKDERFSDHTASCIVLSDTIYVMLLTHDKFRMFTPKAIADARSTSEVLLAVTEDNRAAVDAKLETVRAAGGTPDVSPPQDHGFMYSRSFEDPDGHIWECFFMDIDAAMAAHQDMASAPKT